MKLHTGARDSRVEYVAVCAERVSTGRAMRSVNMKKVNLLFFCLQISAPLLLLQSRLCPAVQTVEKRNLKILQTFGSIQNLDAHFDDA